MYSEDTIIPKQKNQTGYATLFTVTTFFNIVNLEKKIFSVKNYNTTPLPYAEAFWDNNPVIHQNEVIALQNITDQQDELTAIADERRVIIFNGESWI